MDVSLQDRKLLAILQQDSQISNQALADRLAMSPSACWRRVRALEDTGVIKRYVAVVDKRKLGVEFHAIIAVSLERQNREQVRLFIEAVMATDEIIECLAATGDSDYHLRVACTNQQAFNLLMEECLCQLPHVSRLHTSLILKEIKAL